jgi:hypothetical protein
MFLRAEEPEKLERKKIGSRGAGFRTNRRTVGGGGSYMYLSKNKKVG